MRYARGIVHAHTLLMLFTLSGGCGQGESKALGSPTSKEELWGGDTCKGPMVVTNDGKRTITEPLVDAQLKGEWVRLSPGWDQTGDKAFTREQLRISFDACGFTGATATGGTVEVAGGKITVTIDRSFYLEARGTRTPMIELSLAGRGGLQLRIYGLPAIRYPELAAIATTPNPKAHRPQESPRPPPIVVFEDGKLDRSRLGDDGSVNNAPYVALITKQSESANFVCRDTSSGAEFTAYRSNLRIQVYEAWTSKLIDETLLRSTRQVGCNFENNRSEFDTGVIVWLDKFQKR